jgi:hypothetical protein
MDTGSTGRRRNRSWPEALKREIVAASFEPGCSVSVVARRYDVNSNQMFGWRKMFREGSPAQADHFSQKIGIRRLFQKGAKVHHVVGHRGLLRSVNRFGDQTLPEFHDDHRHG